MLPVCYKYICESLHRSRVVWTISLAAILPSFSNQSVNHVQHVFSSLDAKLLVNTISKSIESLTSIQNVYPISFSSKKKIYITVSQTTHLSVGGSPPDNQPSKTFLQDSSPRWRLRKSHRSILTGY